MNGVVIVRTLGRFGNQVIQYLFARAYAESVGAEFRTDPWDGEKVFDLNDKRVGTDCPPLTRRSELDYLPGETNIEFVGYAQNERAMLYTKAQVKAWLKPKFSEEEIFDVHHRFGDNIIAHRRIGDYIGYGYPVVSQASINCGLMKFGFDPRSCWTCTEEMPTMWISRPCPLPQELWFLQDFYRMVRAKVLFRGNSTFSWLAGCLNEGRVFSPVIDGLKGGVEHDVEYVEGNWPRLANLDYTREMRIKE